MRDEGWVPSAPGLTPSGADIAGDDEDDDEEEDDDGDEEDAPKAKKRKREPKEPRPKKEPKPKKPKKEKAPDTPRDDAEEKVSSTGTCSAALAPVFGAVLRSGGPATTQRIHSRVSSIAQHPGVPGSIPMVLDSRANGSRCPEAARAVGLGRDHQANPQAPVLRYHTVFQGPRWPERPPPRLQKEPPSEHPLPRLRPDTAPDQA